MEQSRSFERLGGAAGIAFVVLVMASFFTAPAPPAVDAAVAEVRAYVLDNRSGLLVQALLFALALPLLLFLLEAVRRRLSTDDATAPVATVGALAGMLFFTVAILASASFGAVGWLDDGVGDLGDDAFRLSWNLGYLVYLAVFPLASLSLLAAGWCARRSGGFAAWYWVLSVILGVVLLVGSVGIVSSGVASVSFPSFLGFALWVLVTGILLVARPAASEPAQT